MRAINALRSLFAPSDHRPAPERAPNPPAPEADDELRRLRARNEVLVDYVYRIERQRDDWRHRFYEQGTQHLTGQTMLEEHVLRVGTVLVSAIKLLNEQLALAGKPEVNVRGLHALAKQGGEVLASSTRYREVLDQLASRAVDRDDGGAIVGMSTAEREPDATAEEALREADRACA